ncbi:AAA family ATPase [Perlucidibaca piscinae]|uniref:AAA family ATPase n=1 Tax=Perlucidibaca piscinae TaxID=392589 RepID=UPI0003B57DC7|nr:protein TadZ [Perlucidibaca piscinae]
MSESQQSVVLVSTLREEHEWLQNSLEGTANVVLCQQRELNDVLQLISLAAASIVFVPIRRDNWMGDIQFIEGLVAARPTLACIALSEIQDQERLLGAMRAGARDFITFNARGSELAGLVRRLAERTPSIIESPMQQGSLIVLASERPVLQSAFHALHVAAGIARLNPDARVLLLDLGQPFCEAQMLYGLEGQFNFLDTLRNLRRLDRNLTDTAFPGHKSGVKVLSAPVEGMDLNDITTSEMFLLVGTLRSLFTHVVVNICGLPTVAVTELLIGNANQLVVVVDQSITSCRAGLGFMAHLREIGCPVTHPMLLLDHYQPKIAPDSKAVLRSFGFEEVIELPAEPELRLRAMNLGQLLYEVAPSDPLTRRYEHWSGLYGNKAQVKQAGAGTSGFMGLLKGTKGK